MTFSSCPHSYISNIPNLEIIEFSIFSIIPFIFLFDKLFQIRRYNLIREEAYTQPHYLNSLYDNYNCSWLFRKNAEGQMEQTHDGATQGFSTFFLRIPEKNQAIIVLSNRNNDQQVYELHKYIRKLYNFGKSF